MTLHISFDLGWNRLAVQDSKCKTHISIACELTFRLCNDHIWFFVCAEPQTKMYFFFSKCTSKEWSERGKNGLLIVILNVSIWTGFELLSAFGRFFDEFINCTKTKYILDQLFKCTCLKLNSFLQNFLNIIRTQRMNVRRRASTCRWNTRTHTHCRVHSP